ncbi:hypothetical protein CYMTET_27125, partial [Cymbomonas tetramitiformis]
KEHASAKGTSTRGPFSPERRSCVGRIRRWIGSTPTEATWRKQLFDRLDPDLCKGIVDRYPLPEHLATVTLKRLSQLVARVFVNWQQSAEQGATVRTVASAAVATEDDPESKERLQMIVIGEEVPDPRELHYESEGRRRGSAGGRLTTWRAGGGKRAVFRRKDGAAHCCPLDGAEPEELLTMALCQVFQDAADAVPTAFAQAIDMHGAPAVVRAGGNVVGMDLSAYGFFVPQKQEAGGMLAELDEISSKLTGVRRCAPGVVPAADAAAVTRAATAFTRALRGVAYDVGGSRFALTALSVIMCLAFAGAASTAVTASTTTKPTPIDSATDHGLASPVVCIIGELCLHGGIGDLSPAAELQVLVLDSFFSAAASTSNGAPSGAQLQSGGADIPINMIP